MSYGRKLSGMLLLALGLYLIGNESVSLWDRDEPRYAECSREMLQSGDWVVPTFNPQVSDQETGPEKHWRLEKPPLIYWCQASVMRVLGDTAFSARLPSTIAVLLTALLIGLTVRHFVGEERALWTTLIFCTTGLVIGVAKMCLTDAVLLIFVATGQACLAMFWNCHRSGRKPLWWVAPLFWVTTGLAGLTKGPQAVGMHAMTIAILTLLEVGNRWRRGRVWIDSLRWLRLTRPLLGVPLLAVIVSPWLILIHYRAPGFVKELFTRAGEHLRTGMDGHGEPPGYHTVFIFGTFFPWSLLLPVGLSLAWQNRRTPMVRFAIAAALGPWILMEMVKTKLPFYILPAFPGLAFLMADAVVRCVRGQYKDLTRRSFFVAACVWAAAVLGLGGAPWLALKVTPNVPVAAMTALSICAVVYVTVVLVQIRRQKLRGAIISMAIGMATMIAILYGGVFPKLGFLQLSKRVGVILRQDGGYGSQVPMAMIGYKEPSLAFYQGGGAREQDDSYLAGTPPERWPDWIVITKSIWDNPKMTPLSVHDSWELVAEEYGIVYSTEGRQEAVQLRRRKRPTVAPSAHLAAK